ncbi:hypothetical protein BH23GEM4_BH23GEM4_11850 [soil metagenome]
MLLEAVSARPRFPCRSTVSPTVTARSRKAVVWYTPFEHALSREQALLAEETEQVLDDIHLRYLNEQRGR